MVKVPSFCRGINETGGSTRVDRLIQTQLAHGEAVLDIFGDNLEPYRLALLDPDLRGQDGIFFHGHGDRPGGDGRLCAASDHREQCKEKCEQVQ